MIHARGVARAEPLGALARGVLVLEIVRAYAVARWMLRRRGLRETLSALRAGGGAAEPPANAVAVGRRLGRAVRRTLRTLPADSRCLSSSLVLTRLLAARGIDSQLVIAVQPGEEFGAHAWVEHAGAPLLPVETFGDTRLTTL